MRFYHHFAAAGCFSIAAHAQSSITAISNLQSSAPIIQVAQSSAPVASSIPLSVPNVPSASSMLPSFTATASYSCSTYASRAKYVCGKTGSIEQPDYMGQEGGVSSLDDCRDICLNQKGCVSLGYNAADQVCTQYSRNLKQIPHGGMGLNEDPNSPTIFYNIHCFKCKLESLACPNSCGNEGIQWAMWYADNNSRNRQSPYQYQRMDVRWYHHFRPDFNGVTNQIAQFSTTDGNGEVYNMTNVGPDYVILNHHGYLFATQTGNYKFTLVNTDNAAWIWTGHDAMRAWNIHNYQAYTGLGETQTASVHAHAGRYIPFRIFYAEGARPANFKVIVQDPNGVDLNQGDGCFLQSSCDGSTAPNFPFFNVNNANPCAPQSPS